MSQTDTSGETQRHLDILQQHSQGLFYVSETDASFETIHFATAQTEVSEDDLLSLSGQPKGVSIETVELSWFFRNQEAVYPEASEEEKKIALKFQQLRALLEKELQDIKVYRIGVGRITVLILGKAPSSEYVGLKTFVVET